MEETLEWLLGAVIVLTPIIIFLVTMFVVLLSLKFSKVDIAELLNETEVEIKRQEAIAAAATNPPIGRGSSTPNPPVKRSASRLILFLSGITSLILGVCFTSYYFYMNIYCADGDSRVDMGQFVNVLLELGIGVVPYAVNQVKKFSL